MILSLPIAKKTAKRPVSLPLAAITEICNIMEYAKKLTGAPQIKHLPGRFSPAHDEVPQSQLDKTVEYVKEQHIKNFYICHDTDLHCKLALWNGHPQ
jgi:metal-dependent hydrolase (beta-lactamase superfamily II)